MTSTQSGIMISVAFIGFQIDGTLGLILCCDSCVSLTSVKTFFSDPTSLIVLLIRFAYVKDLGESII